MKNFKITYLENKQPFYRTAKDIEEIKNQLADEEWNVEEFEWMDCPNRNYLTREDYKNDIHKYYKIEEVA